MRPSHEKTPLWQPKRGLDVLISRPPRQAGIPIKPWIQGAGCLWQRTCNYKTSVLRWILCSKKLSKSRLSAQFLSLHKNLTRRAAKQLRTTQPHTYQPHARCKPSPRLHRMHAAIITTRIAGGLLLGYNPNYTCPGLKSFALHFVQVTIAM